MPDKKFFQLGEGATEPFKLVLLDKDKKPIAARAGDIAIVRSSDPSAVIVTTNATPAADTLASGSITGLKPANEVSIQGSVNHADGTASNVAFIVDVGGGVPPPPPPKPPEPRPVLALIVGSPKPAVPPAAPIAPPLAPETLKAGN